ncbi:Chemotaxis protein CheY [uncultured Desulfatiglans sp.]|nr:Chemotaxis protein CheY [uncultured Desulfatiglans sp.]
MSINVLIVDDSNVMRAMILKTLRMGEIELGEVLQAGNGREALERMENHWVDLVIADINMPEMDGEQMIDRMIVNPSFKDIPVLVVSTEGSLARVCRLRQKGARFLHKPFSPEELHDTVIGMLGVPDHAPE